MRCILVFVAVALAAAPMRATQSAPRDATLQGRTINALTGEPVRGALVHLNLDRGPFSNLPPEVEFLTGPDGRFVLRDLPAGTYGLFVTKTGFVDATSDHYELAAGATRDRVEVRLTPAAVISGTVRDDAGDPVPRVTVEVVTGGVDRKRGPSVTTDEAGRYSLGGLDAGAYFVAIRVSPPRGTPVFYPAAPTGEDGTPVEVKAGEERLGVDFVDKTNTAEPPSSRPDARPANEVGRVSGVVRYRSGQGLSRVMVGLMAIEQTSTGERSSARIYTASTDENGQFRLEGVTPGEYRLMAMRPGIFVAGVDFSASPFVEVAAGQTVTGIAITMERPVTVSGTVRDQYGDPIAASVSVFARAGGVNSANTTTSDSQGRYSVLGLRPGEYLLSAETTTISRNVRMFDDSGEERSVAFQPSYYGGVTDASLATPIAIEDRDLAGMDVVIRPVPASTVDVVVDPAGRPFGNVQVQMVPLDANAAAGRKFRTPVPSDSMHVVLQGMAAGQYLLVASGDERDADGSRVNTFWARQEIRTDGFLPQTVRLQLESPARVSGRVVFEGVAKPPTSVMVNLRTLPPGDLQTAFSNQASNSGRGLTFSIDGVMPGRLIFDAVDQAIGRPLWILKSVRAGGRDVFDLPIDLEPGATMNDVVITFADSASTTEVSGTVTDSAGRPVTDAGVIIFSTDNRYWRNTTRHIKAALPDAKGHFTLAGLPPGEYAAISVFTTPTDDVASFLTKLLPTAVRFSLADGEHKVLDVRRVR